MRHNGGNRSTADLLDTPVFGDDRLPPRFWSKVSVADSNCWEWMAYRCALGYGWFRLPKRNIGAHRMAWAELVGPIPEGMVIDHLCRNRACCNPAHLRVCTQRENLHAVGSLAPAKRQAEQTHCKRGHPLSGPNLYVGPDRRRICRTCKRMHKLNQKGRTMEEIRETLLMADVAGRPEHTPEAEPVLVQWCGDAVTIVDDDGRTAVYSRRELLAALGARESAERVAA